MNKNRFNYSNIKINWLIINVIVTVDLCDKGKIEQENTTGQLNPSLKGAEL